MYRIQKIFRYLLKQRVRPGAVLLVSFILSLPGLQALTESKKILFHYQANSQVEQETEGEPAVKNSNPEALAEGNDNPNPDYLASKESADRVEGVPQGEANAGLKDFVGFDQIAGEFSYAFKSWLESPFFTDDTSVEPKNSSELRLQPCSEGSKTRNKSLRGPVEKNQSQFNGIFVGTRSQFDKTNKAGFLIEINEDGTYKNPWLLATLQKLSVSCYPTLLVLSGGKVTERFEGLGQILSSELGRKVRVKTKK